MYIADSLESAECTICQAISLDPTKISVCGHFFCDDHIRTWADVQLQQPLTFPTCPTCRAPFTHGSLRKYIDRPARCLTMTIDRLLTWATSNGMLATRAFDYIMQFEREKGIYRRTMDHFLISRRLYQEFPSFLLTQVQLAPQPQVHTFPADRPPDIAGTWT
jgi:hypothetical protein